VPKKLFRPPDHLIDQWPEVFDGMLINSMPLVYLKILKITFTDGREWHISIAELLENMDADEVISHLLDILEDLDIKNIEFDIDIKQLKLDIKNQINGLF
jgi:hypothetical protein